MSKKPDVPKTTLGKKVRLDVKERLTIRQLFPKQGNLMSQVMASDIGKKVDISQADMKKFGFKETKNLEGNPTGWTWDDARDRPAEFIFTDAEITFLKEQVDRVDKMQEITQDMVTICQKIKSITIGD